MSLFYIFQNGKILLKEGGILPDESDTAELSVNFKYSCWLDRESRDGDRWALLSSDAALPEAFTAYERRSCWQLVGEENFFRINKAFHYMDARTRSSFCGRCGKETIFDETECAMRCPECGELYYPTISPAIIVCVEKEGRILLGHGVNFPPKRYSVLAGFVEPGESLEGCVAREVREEANIEVKNIRYFTSQPWAFPRSLMLGFTAEWASGDIRPQRSELSDVRWFAPDEIPEYYRGVSISAKLIEDFVRRRTKIPMEKQG